VVFTEEFFHGPSRTISVFSPTRCRGEVVRIYFHLKDAQEVLLDVEGVEASGPQQARAQPALVIEELQPKDVQFSSGWTLTATDAAGQVLFAVNLDSTIWS
jgi:hypothetical protein